MKKLVRMLPALLMSVMLAVPVMAEEMHPSRMVDDAGLLTSGEAARVEEELDRISETLDFDVAVVTVDDMGGQSAQDFADDYYDYNGYGLGADYDGAMLVVAMEEREWYITTCGYGMTAISDDVIDYISDQMVPYLSEGDYESAFLTFAANCEYYVENEFEASDYVNAERTEKGMGILPKVAIALVAGFLLALIPMGIMKSQMKTVAMKAEAQDYLVAGSRNLTVCKDQFLYHTINRTARPKETRSSGGGGHVSSSGRSHGGGGGRF